MKKIVLVALLGLLTATGAYYANTYTTAMADNAISINITNPHGMLSLAAGSQFTIAPGDTRAALTLTNNMAVPVAYELEYFRAGIKLSPGRGFLPPGSKDEIYLTASSDCPPGNILLKVTLLADFNGGRARVRTNVPLQVLPPPPPDPVEPEDED